MRLGRLPNQSEQRNNRIRKAEGIQMGIIVAVR